MDNPSTSRPPANAGILITETCQKLLNTTVSEIESRLPRIETNIERMKKVMNDQEGQLAVEAFNALDASASPGIVGITPYAFNITQDMLLEMSRKMMDVIDDLQRCAHSAIAANGGFQHNMTLLRQTVLAQGPDNTSG
ncbi:MAG: hypothetical protein M1828_005040 [Chrysothrix sp. TS-e1954]|nr:MAG: hypothetical protein M1828_005040 [Chrysothrix sp. TS-e1954]